MIQVMLHEKGQSAQPEALYDLDLNYLPNAGDVIWIELSESARVSYKVVARRFWVTFDHNHDQLPGERVALEVEEVEASSAKVYPLGL